MKQIMILLLVYMSASVYSCNSADNDGINPSPEMANENDNEEKPTEENKDSMKIEILIGSAAYTATMEDNEAAKAFLRLLPLRLTMNDVNNNEKYYSLPYRLPTSAINPGKIYTGDLMLWGADGLVLFYKTFSSPYNYTRLGKIDNPEGLEQAVGTEKVRITFRNITN